MTHPCESCADQPCGTCTAGDDPTLSPLAARYPHRCNFCGTPYRIGGEGMTRYTITPQWSEPANPVTRMESEVTDTPTEVQEALAYFADKCENLCDCTSRFNHPKEPHYATAPECETLTAERHIATLTTALAERVTYEECRKREVDASFLAYEKGVAHSAYALAKATEVVVPDFTRDLCKSIDHALDYIGEGVVYRDAVQVIRHGIRDLNRAYTPPPQLISALRARTDALAKAEERIERWCHIRDAADDMYDVLSHSAGGNRVTQAYRAAVMRLEATDE